MSGIICDAETPLDQLVISSSNPAFRAWDASAGEIEVRFDAVQTDPNTQNTLTQPIQLTINDGEDSNTGTLHIMVIENGAPRWSSLPSQSFIEGDGTSILLTSYLTDTDNFGELANPSDLALSIQYISNIGIDKIRDHELTLTNYSLESLAEIDKLKIYGAPTNRGGVITFNIEGIHPHDVAQLLDEDGIAVRAGHHCAQPIMDRLNVSATVRVSFYLYNDLNDIDILLLHNPANLSNSAIEDLQRFLMNGGGLIWFVGNDLNQIDPVVWPSLLKLPELIKTRHLDGACLLYTSPSPRARG